MSGKSRPLTVKETEMSPMRLRVARSLQQMPKGHAFCGATTCDIEKFSEFVVQCRRARVRPPSLYAYVSRCLGVVLEPQRELLSSRYGTKLLVPSRVDVKVLAEVKAFDNSRTPYLVAIEDVAARTLPDIADEIRTRLREVKRTVVPTPDYTHRLAPKWSPQWWKMTVHTVRMRRLHPARKRAIYAACVQLSSTSQWMQGRIGWGIQMFTPVAISITLGGMSRRAVVVGDDIVARWCVDVAFHFDHLLVDGAPATRFIAQLSEEIESGRLLHEYDLPRENTSSTRSSQHIDKTNSEYEEPDENSNDVARYNESRA